MKLLRAKTKALHEFPAVEICCDEMKEIAALQTSMVIDIDIEDQQPYVGKVGHCGQALPYHNSVMTYINGEQYGYTPFELIHIQEGL